MRAVLFEWLRWPAGIHVLLIFIYFEGVSARIDNEGLTTLPDWNGNSAPIDG